MEDKIYIIIKSSGDYEDYRRQNLCAYSNLYIANKECTKLNEELKEKKRINDELSDKYSELLNKSENDYIKEEIEFLENYEYDYYLNEEHGYTVETIKCIY